MTGRGAAECLFAVLSVACAGGLAWVLRACMSGREPGCIAIVVTGLAMLCGLYACVGWAWVLATGVLR